MARLTRALQEEGIDVARVPVEITETAVAHDEDQVYSNLRTLRTLRAAGFEVWIDDVGTGDASLKSVKNDAVSGLKIDREFVKDLPEDATACILTDTILTMARALDHPVVGEGIETEAQRQFLGDRGCQYGQGFLLGRPVSPHEFQARYFETPTACAINGP